MTKEKVSDLALQIAAQCWCDDETKDRVMDEKLAYAFAKRLHVLLADLDKCKAALEFYADEDNPMETENIYDHKGINIGQKLVPGKRARETLREIEGENK